VKKPARINNGLGISVLSTPKDHGDHGRARPRMWAAKFLHGVFLRKDVSHVTHRQKACDGSVGRYHPRPRGQTVKRRGLRPASFIVHDDVEGVRKLHGQGSPRGRTNAPGALLRHPCARADANLSPGGTKLREELDITGVAIVPRFTQENSSARLGYSLARRLCDPGRHRITVPKPDRDRPW